MKVATAILVVVIVFTVKPNASRAQKTFEVAEVSIADLQKAMTDGTVTSRALVQSYLARIEAYDKNGPKLNAIITLNPNAIKEADALDRERATKGPRGPLHGIPVIVKDNYDTGDMQTTAGTMALLGYIPPKDGFQVQKLRAAGAVIIGKSNMHELASGILTVGSAFGQTLNPYDPERIPGGSSGGTGAAVASSFAAAGMGSDTCGSIRVPAAFNNLVGLRPTKGLSSVNGIVPLSGTQDVAGALTRNVSDLATMLDATIGEDPGDPATHLKTGQTRPHFADGLKTDALRGAHIGVLEPLFGDASDDQDVIRLIRAAIEEMKKEGATVESVAMPEFNDLVNGTSVIDFEFKEDLAAYLAHSPNPPVRSLQEILDKGFYHASLEAGLKRRAASTGRDSAAYRNAIAKRAALQAAMIKLMDDRKFDALAYPTMRRKPVRVGDAQPGSTCQLSASTGFPAISIPAGFTADGLPNGVELLARPFDDGKLVGFAYAFEQATHYRRAPALTPPLGSRTFTAAMKWEAKIGEIAGQFAFDPTTSDLRYTLSVAGPLKDEILSATIHRAAKDQIGPVVLVLTNHSFEQLTGSQRLSNADREKLMAGELYLQITTRARQDSGRRVTLMPPR